MLRRSPTLFAFLAAIASGIASAQRLSPVTIERRLRQALWPEVLIGMDGKPERPFQIADFRGDPGQALTIDTTSSLPSFPGLRVYSASAFRCYDCWEPPASVLERDTVVITAIRPEDLAQILPLASPTLRYGDTSRVREAVLELLGGSCILGCRPHLITSKQGLSQTARRLARSASPDRREWKVGPPQTHLDNASMHDEFYVATSIGVYRVSVYQHAGLTYNVFADAVAYTTLDP